jgi:hypothetical protein
VRISSQPLETRAPTANVSSACGSGDEGTVDLVVF